MKRFAPVFLLLFFCLTACGVTVRPLATSTAILDADRGVLKEQKKGIEISLSSEDVELAPYRNSENTTSFFVEVLNLSRAPISLPLSSFYLIDDTATQFSPITPQDVIERVSRDASYLIPYPYVGFYYLEDQIDSEFSQPFSDSLDFYNQNHPEEILSRSLPLTEILPGKRISGTIYFPVDLVTKKSFEVQVFLPETPRTSSSDFTFPFSVEK